LPVLLTRFSYAFPGQVSLLAVFTVSDFDHSFPPFLISIVYQLGCQVPPFTAFRGIPVVFTVLLLDTSSFSLISPNRANCLRFLPLSA